MCHCSSDNNRRIWYVVTHPFCSVTAGCLWHTGGTFPMIPTICRWYGSGAGGDRQRSGRIFRSHQSSAARNEGTVEPSHDLHMIIINVCHVTA